MSSLFSVAAATVGGGHQARSGGYKMQRSVRLRSSASASFSRTPAGAGNRKTWTWSGWVKRGALGTTTLFDGGSTGPLCVLQFNSDQLRLYVTNAGITASEIPITTAVFRDPSAWYHVVCAVDTTQATLANRVKLYVNGIEQTITGLNGTQITLNADLGINRAIATYIGVYSFGTSQYFDGYLTEINFIDGQALTPSDFGQTDPYTGVWSARRYAGTYGTNGFYLNFSDNSAATAAAIGKDYSGNGNNWTPNNISVTAGATYDSMLDVPTRWADGGNGRGNYAVLNPLDVVNGSATLSNGNLNFTGTNGVAISSFGVTTGKWYAEASWTAIGATAASLRVYAISGVYAGYLSNGQRDINITQSAYGATFTTNDVIGVAFDIDAGTVEFFKNGTSQGSISYSMTGSTWYISTNSRGTSGTNTGWLNFGQRPFTYTPPSGFRALNTQNLP